MIMALKGMWKETVIVQLLFRLLPGGTEYNHEKPTLRITGGLLAEI
jgi:hypothetical protein